MGVLDVDEHVAALSHRKLLPAATVRKVIETPLPTGLELRRRRASYQLRLRVATWTWGDRLSLFDRLPGLRHRVVCPLCGWHGGWFRPGVAAGRIRLTMRCPHCRAGRRHRLFWLAWQATRHGDAGLCLHMAPEDWLAPLVAAEATAVVTMDLETGGVHINADAERLPFQHGSIDTIVSNDVLEHVEHDDLALQEIARVLSPIGLAFLHTPVVSTETVEYGFANPLEHGHRRAYGPDLVRRIRDAGLELTVFSVSALTRRDSRRYGLPAPDAVLIARRAD